MRSDNPAAISPLRLGCAPAKPGAPASARAAPLTARKSRRPIRPGRGCRSRMMVLLDGTARGEGRPECDSVYAIPRLAVKRAQASVLVQIERGRMLDKD